MTVNEALIKDFSQRWQALGGFLYRASDAATMTAALHQAWDDLVGDSGDCPSVVAWLPPTLRDWDLEAALALHGSIAVTRWSGRMEMREASHKADLGITGAAWAVADTGSVALYSTEETGLLPSVLPPAHLMLVDRDAIVGTVADGLRLLARRSHPPMVKLITGPSMTADIEGTLVTGVHGPGKVGVIIYQVSSAWG